LSTITGFARAGAHAMNLRAFLRFVDMSETVGRGNRKHKTVQLPRSAQLRHS
jgi:hypothetical protein